MLILNGVRTIRGLLLTGSLVLAPDLADACSCAWLRVEGVQVWGRFAGDRDATKAIPLETFRSQLIYPCFTSRFHTRGVKVHATQHVQVLDAPGHHQIYIQTILQAGHETQLPLLNLAAALEGVMILTKCCRPGLA